MRWMWRSPYLPEREVGNRDFVSQGGAGFACRALWKSTRTESFSCANALYTTVAVLPLLCHAVHLVLARIDPSLRLRRVTAAAPPRRHQPRPPTVNSG